MKSDLAASAESTHDASSRTTSQAPWTAHILVAVFYAILIAAIFLPWLRPFHQPLRGGPELSIRAGDLTPLFSVWCQISRQSLLERGEWPLWSDHIYCGEPFFAKPQIGVLSLTTLLCLFMPAHVAATWTFLLHLWIAGMGMYGWCSHILSRRSERSHAFPCANGAAAEGFSSQLTLADRRDAVASGEEPGLRVIVECIAAACGGVVFMLSGLMVEHTMIGHGPIVLVACWTPLVLWLIARALAAAQPARFATAAGALVAVQLLAGGETVFLYNAIAGTLLAVAWIAVAARSPEQIQHPANVHRSSAARDALHTRAPASVTQSSRSPSHLTTKRERSGVMRVRLKSMRKRLVRTVAVGAFVGLAGFGLAAVKVLPGLELMPISNRAGGLSLQDAGGFVLEFTEPAVLNALGSGLVALGDLQHLFALTLILGTTGIVCGLCQQSLRWYVLAAVLLIAAGVAIAHSQATFALLWKVLPMFRYQRIPQRALILAYLGLAIVVSIGAQSVFAYGSDRLGTWLRGIVLLLLVTGESWIALPPLPPSGDIRQEVRDNSILNYIAREPGRFRIHAIESNDRNWGIEHVTVPLGLSNLSGWDHLWLLEYLGAEGTKHRDVRPFLAASYELRHPARFWGMMNVRYVTSTRQVQVPGLQFAAAFPVSHRSQPAKSAGPYLYENLECLERAWIAPNAILVLGHSAERIEATYHLLDHPEFDPRRTVVIQSDRSSIANSANELMHYNAVALPARWASKETTLSLEQSQRRSLSYTMVDPIVDSRLGRVFRWSDPNEVRHVVVQASRLPHNEQKITGETEETNAGGTEAAIAGGTSAPQVESSTTNRVRVRVPRQAGFLVLAEKFAHFPGWLAHSDRGPRPLLRANGVASAIQLDGSESWIELRYRPTGLTIGLGITLASLILGFLIGCYGDRLACQFRNKVGNMG